MGMEFLYIVVVVAIIIGIGMGLLQSSRGKGWIGEQIVKIVIGKTKEGKKYVINDLRLKVSEDRTSQIDHVLINEKGIFVIETKNYSGRIYGKESQLEWTQVLNYGKVKNKLYNPVKQNKTHVYHISNMLSERLPIFSAVVFIQGNTQYIESENVYSLKGLKRLISQEGKNVLSIAQMQTAYNELSGANDQSISLREHVENIENMRQNIQDGICPRCGKKMVVRHGKSGDFMGCTGYPECKFTKKI